MFARTRVFACPAPLHRREAARHHVCSGSGSGSNVPSGPFGTAMRRRGVVVAMARGNNGYDGEEGFVHRGGGGGGGGGAAAKAPPTTTALSFDATSTRSSSCGSAARYFFPRTIRQEEYASLLRSSVASYDTPDIIVASGPAGTCKTLAATLVGVEKLMAGEVERLVLTRPAVSADESLGFLPGTLEDKMHVWLLPIFDVMRASMKPREIERMMTSDAIEICSLSHMRGRTFHDSYVIVDECQNTTPSQMLMLMTRIGAGSRMVFTGDPMQHDRRPPTGNNSSSSNNSGLSDLMRRIAAAEGCEDAGIASAEHHLANAVGGGGGIIRVFEFDAADIQRHRAISHVLALYEH